MTQKDFELIAAVIRSTQPRNAASPGIISGARHEQFDKTARAFADRLANVNPRFKRDVFLRDCGVES
jgi:hypothetical protein